MMVMGTGSAPICLGRRVHTWEQISDAFSRDIRYTVIILMNLDISSWSRAESPLLFGFTGYLTDRAGGLYYANAREYHAGSGRFLTKDLNSYMDLKDPNTLNLYQYVKGNPLKYVDYSGHESICEKKSYLERTLDMVIYGSYSDEFTWLGLGIQLGLGFFNLDFPCDVRDFTADITVNKDTASPTWWGTTVLDAVAFVPVIGEVKYLGEVSTGVKSIFKNSDEVIDGGRHVARVADALGDISKKGGTALDGMADSLRATAIKNMKNADILNDAKYVDDVANAASDVGKRLDDLANAASDAGKKLDDLAGGGAGGKFQEVFDLADDYTLSDNTFNNHILDRHGSNSTYKNKSHFNEDFDIREGIDSTLKGDNFVVGPNTAGREGYIFEQTFTNPIGINSKGKLLYTLKVVIDENGNVITAFPKN